MNLGPYPTSPGWRSAKFRSREPNVVDVTQAGQVDARGLGGQWWEFTAHYQSLRKGIFQPVKAFVTRLAGRRNTCTVIVPTESAKSGDAIGAITVNGIHAIGDDTITLNTFTGTLKAGDYLKFAHDKVYLIGLDRVGAGDVTIYPPLIEAVADTEAVVYDDVPFTCRLDNDVQEWGLLNNSRRTFEVDFREAT